MPDRFQRLLRLGCLVLAAVFLLQLLVTARHGNPLRSATLPDLPTWSPPPPETNAPAAGPSAGRPGPMPPPGMAMRMPPGGPGGPRGGRSTTPPLSSTVQKRIDHIVQNQLLGPIIRPPPMALLGIAGPDVLLRGPQGQSGLLRVGEDLGGIHLVRIGTNRVLVRDNGELKELTLFDGMGGESLLPSSNPVTTP